MYRLSSSRDRLITAESHWMTSVSNKSPAQVIRVLCKLVTKINEFIQTFFFLFFICSSPMNELISIHTYFF